MKLNYLTFDPRSKLAIVLFASFLLMLRVNWMVESLFVLVLCGLLIINGGWRKGVSLTGFYFLLLVIEILFVKEIKGPLSAFFSFILVANRLLIPPIMSGMFAMNQTKMSEWIAAMKKMKVPTVILVPFSVVCRFFPVLIHDFKQIRQAMKFRGIGMNAWDLVRHPILTLEYIIVPILVSVENTSVELSAAALVRGLGSETKHTSIHDIKFKIQDGLLFLFLIIFFSWGVLLA